MSPHRITGFICTSSLPKIYGAIGTALLTGLSKTNLQLHNFTLINAFVEVTDGTFKLAVYLTQPGQKS